MRRVLAWIIITFPLFLLGDFSSIGSNEPVCSKESSTPTVTKADECKASTAGNAMEINENNKEFVFMQYKTAVEEIRNRIGQEHLLFALKFTIVGGVLGIIFLMRKTDDLPANDVPRIIASSPYKALFFWAAVAVSAIMDARMVFNMNIISELGHWVCTVEAHASNSFEGWEHYIANSELRKSIASPFLLIDRQLLTWVLYIVAFFLFTVEHSKQNADPEDSDAALAVLRISMYANPLCYVLFGFVGIHFYYDETSKIVSYFLLLVVLTVISTSYIIWLRNSWMADDQGENNKKQDINSQQTL
ncbi:hypothetical protein [Kaarinaea lacus]